MSKRPRALRLESKPEAKPLSDKTALIWRSVIEPLNNAAAAYNAAAAACREAVLARMAELDGVDVSPEGGWKFDIASNKWVRHVGA